MSRFLHPKLMLVTRDPVWAADAVSWLQLQGYSCLCAGSTAEAEALMSLQAPDVVVLDLNGGMDDPLAFILATTARGGTQVILVGSQSPPLSVTPLHPNGTGGWPDAPTPHLATLRHALERLAPSRARPGTSVDGHLPVLTPRERDLVGCLAAGMQNQAIAKHLAISEKTVRNLLTRLYGKLGVSSRTQALTLLQQHGMVRS